MKRLIVVLGILVLFVFSVSASNVLAQPGNQCEGNFDLDQDVDGTSAAVFKQDFGRSGFSNPCPEPPFDVPPIMSKYERMFCEASPECWAAGYEFTPMFNEPICCCWDQTLTFNYGCRGFEYCELNLMGICF
jgi:hypothetical protein